MSALHSLNIKKNATVKVVEVCLFCCVCACLCACVHMSMCVCVCVSMSECVHHQYHGHLASALEATSQACSEAPRPAEVFVLITWGRRGATVDECSGRYVTDML